jgi:deoxyribose-phosphate aldolase
MGTYTPEQVAKVIDHAVLKPFATDDDVVSNAAMCIARGVGNFCVRPTDAPLAVEKTKNSNTTVAVVVGFPHGHNRPEVKALEARLAVEDGAVELDMVMNIGKFLSGDHELVQRDIAGVVDAAHPKAIVKVILETVYLSDEQIAKACQIAKAAGADMVKTSTGFFVAGGPTDAEGSKATPQSIQIMLDTVGDTMGVKASGGVRDWQTAVGYLDQGCQRLGVGSTEKVLDGGAAAGDGDY